MKFALAAAAALAALASPLAAQSFDLECEQTDTNSISVGGRSPINQVTVGLFTVSVDPAAKKALFRFENPDGTPGTTLRDILMYSPREIVLCQADVCQRQVPIDGFEGASRTFGLTTIDLQSGRLSRRADSSIPDRQLGALITAATVRDGICRKV
ncbi:MAG TPA: hypothetical protein VF027_07060 [Sphingomicrobium sp.]